MHRRGRVVHDRDKVERRKGWRRGEGKERARGTAAEFVERVAGRRKRRFGGARQRGEMVESNLPKRAGVWLQPNRLAPALLFFLLLLSPPPLA